MYTSTLSKALLVLLSLTHHTLSAGTQFITGPCNSDADCASSCCGFNSGLCAGPVIAQTRDGGCGHGDAQPNNIAALAFFSSQSAAAAAATSPAAAAAAPPATSTGTSSSGSGTSSGSSTGSKPPINSSIPGSENVGKANGAQFITGQCFSDADCASGCCGFNTGLCAGAVIAQTRDGGCGFGNAQPNDNAAKALTGEQPTSAASAAPAPASTGTSSSSGSGTGTSSGSSTGSNPPINNSIPGSENVGKANGSQFITGQCFSDADCASGCCGFKTGLCAGAIIAQTRDGGCGFGSGTPNDNAAKALTGAARRRRSEVREFMA